MDALYYEVHVSIRTRTSSPQLALICDKYQLKCSQIVGDEPDTILTTRKTNRNAAARVLHQVITECVHVGIVVTRSKIEAALIDNKHLNSTQEPE